MSKEEQTFLMVRGLVATLPQVKQSECQNLIKSLRQQISDAGDIGFLALTYLAAEAQLLTAEAR